jgi:hypothetical protein
MALNHRKIVNNELEMDYSNTCLGEMDKLMRNLTQGKVERMRNG